MLIFHVCRFFHFAHAVVFTSGAYFMYLFKVWLGFPFLFAIPLAILSCSFLGCLIDITVYRPLRLIKTVPMVLLLASLGLYILLQNTISVVFGDDTKSVRNWEVKEGLNILGARITPVQILIIASSIIITIALAVYLKKSKMGKAMRAVASDPELSNVSGIDSNRVILWSFAIGSGLAAIAGILVCLDVDMTPTMGLNALLMGVVAVIIGGSRRIWGVVLGALLLGFAQHFGVLMISSQWQDAIAFIILLIFLVFKPEGFTGKKLRKDRI